MKRLILLVLLIPLLSGIDLNNAARPIRPLKVNFHSVPDNSVTVTCVPTYYGVILTGAGWVGGNASHMGKIDLNASRYTVTGCDFNYDMMEAIEYLQGNIVSASGDYYSYHGMATISFIDGKITGTITIDGGSGRFKNAMGEVSMDGYASLMDNTAKWTGDGWISY